MLTWQSIVASRPTATDTFRISLTKLGPVKRKMNKTLVLIWCNDIWLFKMIRWISFWQNFWFYTSIQTYQKWNSIIYNNEYIFKTILCTICISLWKPRISWWKLFQIKACIDLSIGLLDGRFQFLGLLILSDRPSVLYVVTLWSPLTFDVKVLRISVSTLPQSTSEAQLTLYSGFIS